MTSTTTGKSLYELGLSCLLAASLLVWSSLSPVSPVGKNEGQFEQLADRAAHFLVKHWDSPTDEPVLTGTLGPLGIRPAYKPLLVAVGESVEHRIRISSYPVIPQAPPSLV